jgi:hypothetical protein
MTEMPEISNKCSMISWKVKISYFGFSSRSTHSLFFQSSAYPAIMKNETKSPDASLDILSNEL